MKLSELDAELVRFETKRELVDVCPPEFADRFDAWQAAGCPTNQVERDRDYLVAVRSLAEAQAIELECPKCRGHHVLVAFAGRGVLDHQGSRNSAGQPTRWQIVSGTGLSDLTLSPSIDCTPSNPNCWHGFITNGEAT